MKIVVSGASGFIGTALTTRLAESGHDVHRLVRRAPKSPSEHFWDPAAGEISPTALQGAQAVVNLSGASVAGGMWTRSHIEKLYSSRLASTKTLAAEISRMDTPPPVFVSGSASGFYGDAGEQRLDELHLPGSGYLADICLRWEEAARAVPQDVTVTHARTGIVLAARGGALGPLLPALKTRWALKVGTGRQWWPWITLLDEVRALEFLATHPISGAVNLAAPVPATMGDVLEALTRELGGKVAGSVPEALARRLGGAMAEEMLLSSQKMAPDVLESAGFFFIHRSIHDAARWIAHAGPSHRRG